MTLIETMLYLQGSHVFRESLVISYLHSGPGNWFGNLLFYNFPLRQL